MRRLCALVACCFCFTAQAAKICPAGDGPAAMGPLEVIDVNTTVDVADGVARASWRITLKNAGNGPARAALDFATDEREAPLIVDAARIAGRHRAALVDADDAAAAFDAFTRAMQDGVDDPVAGSARIAIRAALAHDEGVVVDVAAACSQRRIVIHVEGAAASLPRAGGARFVLPRLTARDRITINAADADIWADGRTLPASGIVAVDPSFVDDDGDNYVVGGDDLVVEIRAHAPRLRATGIVRAFTDTTLVQAGLDLPAPLTTTPADLRIVFVVDASVSAGDAGIATALRLVDRVLDEAPADTRWSLVTAARAPRLLIGPWRARDDRFVPAISVENGSDIPAAIRMATSIADDVDGTARVIVLSDLQLAREHEATLTSSLIPAATAGDRAVPVLHMISLPGDAGEGRLSWHRVSDDALARDTERRGGVFIAANEGDDDEQALARYLIRPTRLDDVQLFVDGVAFAGDEGGADDLDVYDVAGVASEGAWPLLLDEGQGLRLARLLPTTTTRVELRARAWSTPIVLPIDVVDAVAAAGTAINGQLRDEVPTEVVEVVATRLGFVSSMTSLLDVPKWRPADTDLGTSGFSASCGCGCGIGGISGIGSGIRCLGTTAVVKARAILDALAVEVAQTCKTDVHAEIEVGDLEILTLTTMSTTGVTKRQIGCIRELLWAARLDQLTPGDGSFEAHTLFATKASYTPETTEEDGADENNDDDDDDEG